MYTLPNFYGDVAWVHAREDYAGAPSVYWPGGASGVTLRPGVDLGHADWDLVRSLYAKHIEPAKEAVRGAQGIKGQAANTYLKKHPELKKVRISYEDGHELFALAALPYWTNIVQRFPSLTSPSVPPEVHTVMLSLAFNRGAGNPGLEVLRTMIDSGDWSGMASAVSSMQQNHKLRGISMRRRMEGKLLAEAAEREEKVWTTTVSPVEVADQQDNRAEQARAAIAKAADAASETIRTYLKNRKPL